MTYLPLDGGVRVLEAVDDDLLVLERVAAVDPHHVTQRLQP